MRSVIFTNYNKKKVNDGSNVVFVKNIKGPTLGYSNNTNVKILTIDGLNFKDLNRNGKLDKYEDWRLPVDERAKDLAAKLSVSQIASLMLFSSHQAIPETVSGPNGQGTYNGRKFVEGDIDAASLTDQQKNFVKMDNVRHFLITNVQSAEIAARWNNNLQALAEGIDFGIPVNISSDPRHAAKADAEYTPGLPGQLSQWPNQLGLAASFDPELVQHFASTVAAEYRAIGITTALSPQIDIATEPRWARVNGTFGEDPLLVTDMARAYVDGLQTSTGANEIADGWGYTSVNAMMKHWPGGGSEEGGRDGHYAYGKYNVYPGNNFDEHLTSFVNGAMKLQGKTRKAAAAMPYYAISYNQDKNGENIGNSFSKYMITDLLRDKYSFDGVVCTDWLVTANEGNTPDNFAGKPWGLENKSLAERHYKILMAGVDQFGGNTDVKPIIDAYNIGVKEHSEVFMRARFKQSAVRILRNMFRLGLFENPYLEVEKSKKTVGNADFMAAGYNAQLKSIVLLKNQGNLLPLQKTKTVYVPKKFIAPIQGYFGAASKEKLEDPVKTELLKKYFNVTDNPAKADCSLVFINSPIGQSGYSGDELSKGGTGYIPISLQYSPYNAGNARLNSLAAGDPAEPKVNNRSYKGKASDVSNFPVLKTIYETKKLMKGKPIIVIINMSRPTIPLEFEHVANAIIVDFGVQQQAILDIISGKTEPSALLPFQLPANMQTVELQYEDVPHDMISYKDAMGNAYDFGFGLNWKGVIKDTRTTKYVNSIAKPVITFKGDMASITCATPGTKIYFTTNNTTPAFTEANEYAKPFKVSPKTTIKAIAKKQDIDNSVLVVLTKEK